jgi:hypothetical protein
MLCEASPIDRIDRIVNPQLVVNTVARLRMRVMARRQ